MGEGKRRVVLDTNVLISALGWNGPERRLYRACLTGHLQLCMTTSLLEELMRVLDYPKFGFPIDDRRGMMEDVLRSAYFSASVPTLDVIPEDPSDNHVLACALASRADVIVTGDAHLLRLGKFEGIPILKAAAFK